MRFAIIGAGVTGRTHAARIAELAPRAMLALVADEVPGRAAALDAGKHVIVEKPVDVTLRAARLLAAAEARAAAMVTVVSQHRFDSSSQVVHRAIQEGRLGRLTSAVASVAWWRGQDYYDSGDWRGTWALDGGVVGRAPAPVPRLRRGHRTRTPAGGDG